MSSEQLKRKVFSEKEIDAFLAKKAKKRLKNLNQDDLISIEDAFRKAGWSKWKL